MNRSDFLDFCAANDLTVGENGEYVYAVIRGEDCFAAAQHLLESEDAWLVSAERKDGAWAFSINDHGRIYEDQAKDVAAAMADEYARVLDETDNVTYVSAESLALRDRLMEENPAMEGEDEDEYLRRLEDLAKHEWVFTREINEAGFWDADYNLIVSAADLDAGIWSYDYDNWEQKVLLVLDPDKAEEEEEDAA